MQHSMDPGYDMSNNTRHNAAVGATPHTPTRNAIIGFDPWWWWSLEEDRLFTLPSSMIRFPPPHMQLVVFRNDPNSRPTPTEQSRRVNSGLTLNEQRKAFEKLKKEIYNPIPKKIIQRLGKFYRQKDARNAPGSGGQKAENEVVEDDNEDKKCVVCLEDFEAKTVVMVTPCNHMFHEDCIVPWVKSHGRCPLCRFSFYEEKYGAPSTSNDMLANDLISFVASGGRILRPHNPFGFESIS